MCGAVALAPRALGQPASAKDAPHEPRGVYARISLKANDEMIGRLGVTFSTDRRAAIQEVLARPAAFMPPALYALANALAGEEPERAIFMYHVGRMRAVYDALRCRDKTARAGLIYLRKQLGPELIRLLATRPERVLRLAQNAVDWDAANPQDYDIRWIALFGKVSRTSSGDNPDEVTVPLKEWSAIHRYVHETHLKSVRVFGEEKGVK